MFDLDIDVSKVDSMEIKGSFLNSYNEGDLFTEKLKPRKGLKPLLKPISQISPPKLDYLGTAFGLTLSLFSFWQKNGYEPVYLRQTKNNITGEHSCIMIQLISEKEISANETSKNWV